MLQNQHCNIFFNVEKYSHIVVKNILTQKKETIHVFFQNSIFSLGNSADPDQLASLEAS